MKKITLLLMAFSFIKVAYCQTLKSNGINRATEYIYTTKTVGNNRFIISNTNNILLNRKPKLEPTALNYVEKSDKTALEGVFKQVFTDIRLKQLLPENGIFINFYVNPQGQVLEVAFSLQQNTIITANELEELEKSIKKNINFKLLSKETKGGDFFIISEFARYSKALNGTLQ